MLGVFAALAMRISDRFESDYFHQNIMSYIKLAKEIREKNKSLKEITNKLQSELDADLNKCKHQKCVVVCSEYSGSYSYDYDDGHDEIRQCLICGRMEHADKKEFKRLLNPFVRLELGYPYNKNNRYKESPLANVYNHKLTELIDWCNKNGFKV